MGMLSRRRAQRIFGRKINPGKKQRGTSRLDRISEKSEREEQFSRRWKQLGGPELTAQFVFHPMRKWRLDFAIPELRLGFEVHGGIWTKGRHVRGTGFHGDRIKMILRPICIIVMANLIITTTNQAAWGCPQGPRLNPLCATQRWVPGNRLPKRRTNSLHTL